MMHEVLRFYYPNSQFSCGVEYESINWLDPNTEKPTKEKVIELTEKYTVDYEKEKLRKSIISQIELLEKKTYRPLREITLGNDTAANVTRLTEIDSQIQTLRSQL